MFTLPHLTNTYPPLQARILKGGKNRLNYSDLRVLVWICCSAGQGLAIQVTETRGKLGAEGKRGAHHVGGGLRRAIYSPSTPKTPQTLRRKEREMEEKPIPPSSAQGHHEVSQLRGQAPAPNQGRDQVATQTLAVLRATGPAEVRHPAPARGRRGLGLPQDPPGEGARRDKAPAAPAPAPPPAGRAAAGPLLTLPALPHYSGRGCLSPARRRPAQQLLLLRLLFLWGRALAGQPAGRRLGKGSGHLSAPPRTPQPWAISSPRKESRRLARTAPLP